MHYPSKHWNSGPVVPNMGILTLSFETLEFWSYPSKHWNSSPYYSKHWYLSSYSSKHWSSDLILRNIGILMLSLQTLELCPCPCTPWNSSRVLWNIITFISFSKHRNYGLFFYKLWISRSYPSKHWNSPLSFQTLQIWSHLFNIGVSTLSFKRIEFLPYPSKHWHSALILLKIIILALSFETLEFWSYPSKH